MVKKSSRGKKDKKKRAYKIKTHNNKKILPLIILSIAILLFIIAKNRSSIQDRNFNQSYEVSNNKIDVYHPEYVGAKICSDCHQEQFKQWSDSPHDLAMQVANDKTVLGNFNDTGFKYFGVSSKFYRNGEKFMVRTDGPDGKLKDYEIKYTFGYYPLQQYLIDFPGGRLQALGIAWDSRPKSEGGQRWFHLYPDSAIKHDDALHWTGLNQNWNFMCAECHSTNLNKNYNAVTNSYNTTWTDINVSCEACHGPGSSHVKWAEVKHDKNNTDSDTQKGLLVRLEKTSWEINQETEKPVIQGLQASKAEIDVCSQCHSRRAEIWKDYEHGKPIMDSYLPSLIDQDLYYPDGQIKEEVYVYGSFLQSKMYQKGVSCSDCHEPHSLKLRKKGNDMCTSCHLSSMYDTESHYFHDKGSAGASCVGCHMPETKYMVVDPRRDHSIRIPRPDLTEKLGIPNPCNKCHQDETSSWAENKVNQWYGTNSSSFNSYVEGFHAAQTRSASAEQLLLDVANDKTYPDIIRATAIKKSGNYISPQSIVIIKKGLIDSDPLVRLGAVEALEGADPNLKLQLVFNLLNDPVRSVRIRAVGILKYVPENQLSTEQKKVLENATKEYIQSQKFNADRPESHLSLGLLYIERGDHDQAEEEYNKAIELQPTFVQAYVNLADLYRIQGKEDKGEKMLLDAIKLEPGNADAYHAYGLLLVRQNRTDEALKALEKSAKLNTNSPRYSYVYAVALNSIGSPDEAIKVLEQSYARNHNDRETLYALVTFNRDIGNIEKSIDYAGKLVALFPWDTSAQQLLQELKQPKD